MFNCHLIGDLNLCNCEVTGLPFVKDKNMLFHKEMDDPPLANFELSGTLFFYNADNS
jgi:hypothetical protein